MAHIDLPRLAGSRDDARELFVAHDVPASLTGEMLVAYCRLLAYGSETFADELVKQALVLRDAAELALVGVSREFEQHVRAAALRRGVAGRVRLRRGVEVDA